MRLTAYEKDMLCGMAFFFTVMFLMFGGLYWLMETHPPKQPPAAENCK